MTDFKAFFETARKSVNLTDANVDGLQRIVSYGESQKTQVNDLAYLCGTAFWETGGSCQPVEECYYLGTPARVKAAQRKLRYYPHFGRGLAQTTWPDNYRKVAKLLGLPEDFFLKDPDKLLEWEFALPALFKASETGLYTGKALSDYIDDLDEGDAEDRREYINARRVINGTDKAAKIADLALAFERALKAGGYGKASTEPETVQAVRPDPGLNAPEPPVQAPQRPADAILDDNGEGDATRLPAAPPVMPARGAAVFWVGVMLALGIVAWAWFTKGN